MVSHGLLFLSIFQELLWPGGGRGVTSIKYNETIGYTPLQPLRTGQVGNMRDKLCPDHLALEQTSAYQSFKRQSMPVQGKFRSHGVRLRMHMSVLWLL